MAHRSLKKPLFDTKCHSSKHNAPFDTNRATIGRLLTPQPFFELDQNRKRRISNVDCGANNQPILALKVSKKFSKRDYRLANYIRRSIKFASLHLAVLLSIFNNV